MAFVINLHQGLARMAILYFLFIGVWGLYRAIRGRDVEPSYMGALVIAQLLLMVNIIVGAVLWFNGFGANMQRAEVHLLYGAFVLIFLPFVFVALLKGDDSNRAQWVWSFVTLFMFGVAERFFDTGL